MDASTCHPELRNIWNNVSGGAVEMDRWQSGGMRKGEDGQDGVGKWWGQWVFTAFLHISFWLFQLYWAVRQAVYL